MIIDCHGHVGPPAELWVYKSHILSHRGEHGRRIGEISDEEILVVREQEGDGAVWPSRHARPVRNAVAAAFAASVPDDAQCAGAHSRDGISSERTPYTLHFINEESIAVFSLVNSDVFKDFPRLKVVISHGGGAIPYQIGRFQSGGARRGIDFLERMRHMYYDTVLYSEEALRLLIKTVRRRRKRSLRAKRPCRMLCTSASRPPRRHGSSGSRTTLDLYGWR